MPEYGQGFAGGMAQGMQNAMSLFRQNEMIELEQKRLNMQTWGRLAGLSDIWRKSKAFGEAATKSTIMGLGLDPSKGQGKLIFDMYAKADETDLQNYKEMATQFGLGGADPSMVRRVPIAQWPDLFKQMQTAQGQKMQSIAATAFPTDTISGGSQQPQPVTATGSTPAGANGAVPAVGGGTGASAGSPPQATPVAGAPNAYATKTAQLESSGNPDAHNPTPGSTSAGLYGITDGTLATTLKNHPELAGIPDPKNNPQVLQALREDNAKVFLQKNGRFPTPDEERFMHQYGPNAPMPKNVPSVMGGNTIPLSNGHSVPLDPSQGTQYATFRTYKALMNRADLVEQAGGTVGQGLAEKYRTQAMALKDAATIQLTPEQAAIAGYKPNAVVTRNLITGEEKLIQQGNDTFRTASGPDAEKLGFLPNSVVSVNNQTGQVQTVQQGNKTYHVLTPEEMRAANVNPRDGAVMREIQTGKIVPVTQLQNENALAGGTATSDVKKFMDLQDKGAEGIKLSKFADFMDKVNTNAGAGILTEPELIAGRLLDAFGLDDKAGSIRTGLQEGQEAAYAKLATNLAASLSTRNISAKEIGYIKQAGPALFRTKLGDEILQDIVKQAANTDAGVAQIARDHLKQPNVRELSDPDQNGKTFWDKQADFLKNQGAMSPDLEKKIDMSLDDLSGGKIIGISAPISTMSADDLKRLNAQVDKLSPGQRKLAADRWEELNKGGQGGPTVQP